MVRMKITIQSLTSSVALAADSSMGHKGQLEGEGAKELDSKEDG